MFLEHNSHDLLYRTPHGAVKTGTKITLRLSIESASIPEKVECILNNTAISMHYAFHINSTRIYECEFYSPDEEGLVFYYFYCECDENKLYYGNNSLCLGGIGEAKESTPEFLYQITVYDKDFKTPDWAKRAVFYQIFPDRFCREGDTPFHGIKREWNSEPFYKKEQFGGEYLSNDFFGGNFKGIKKKLGYLKDLGINAIYLNPIFKSPSNHRYNTSDYEIPDETLGTTDDFKELTKTASSLGIKIILDGVFSHTGADSVYFNKYDTFDSLGAYQSKDSPYYSWYNFYEFPYKYESWWGFDTLPNVRELDESYLSFILGENGIAQKWLRLGAFGWRLDVADELPDEFIEKMRTAIKKENKDSFLLGEVWEDASKKESYGKKRRFLLGKSLDSVMNYVFRSAVLDYLTLEDSSLFLKRISSLYENYPKEALYCALNLISSHDVPRALTPLSGAPDFRTIDRNAQHDYVIDENSLHLARKRMRLAFTLQMTLPGAPSVYYGDEVGLSGYADPFNRAPFPEDKKDDFLFSHLKKLIAIRNSTPCLQTGDFNPIFYKNSIICFMRSISGDTDIFGNKCTNGSVLVIINSSSFEDTIELDLGRFHVHSLYDMLTEEAFIYKDKITFNMPPFSQRVLHLERNENECIKIQSTQK